ncbi:WcaF family extracellular polysaccharide biosynthesis acetyltransferase [Pontibacter sp. SGAir0037]|uniref:WcaF family extracellular polysaccharide biosynthesis acetyltransferase n=1 Tax=Pontibacter sp. SGAir0037 TaxID=2571030 RepID=UPI0010CCE20D|nr:WcaF family extracellular polysaccharide biosynthesis acetyltransferase [Pontibacter sp. SGAir0037]QCR22594.1 colanic acid biosynthesis acetyltransferase WcaF [Pontibacter sp. SGAir0037]
MAVISKAEVGHKLVYQDLSTFDVPASFRGKSKLLVQLWWIVQGTLFSMSPQVFYGWRVLLLRFFGAQIGKGVKIRSSVKITYPWNLEIGNHCWVGDDTSIYNLGNVRIGNHVAIAHKVYINTGGHAYDKITFDIFSKPVYIEDECWITNDVYIAPGTTIGKGTIVSARSSVLKNLPAGKICVGTPAVPIKDRTISDR